MGPADRADAAAALSVTVAYSPRAGEIDSVVVVVPDGATVADALRESGLARRHAEVDVTQLAVGVWGALVDPADRLRDRDRVEIYRPLQVDPKDARRLRQQKQRKSLKR